MVKKIIIEKKLTDEEMEKKKGCFIESKGFIIYDKSVDIYNEEGDLLVIYRKKSLPEKYKKLALPLKFAAIKGSNNRGVASGEFDVKKYKKIMGIDTVKVSKFRGVRINKSGEKGSFTVAMPSRSGMIGNFIYKGGIVKKTASLNNKKNEEIFEKSYPFIQWVDKQYKKYVPIKYAEMKKNINKKISIANTIFSTITVNENFRTACHKDKRDIGKLGNLVVLFEGEIKGGYLLLPQYKIGIKVQDRDFLLMDVHQYHCNSSISGKGNRYSFVFYAVD